MASAENANAHDSDLVSILDTTDNNSDSALHELDCEVFATLAARFALAGHSLLRTEAKDGPVSFYARRFLTQIGGAA